MGIEIKNTRNVKADGVKMCVYGKGGIGKTTMMGTAPSPIILSCESGLLSLSDVDVPYIEIATMADLHEAYAWLNESEEARDFETIALDSITEMAEVQLTELKASCKDPRQAYGELADDVSGMIRSFRDMRGKNVIFSAKMSRVTDDDTNVTKYGPLMPGKTLTAGLPYFFDELFYMDLFTDDEGKKHRVLRTETTYNYEAKDRSGVLDDMEPPDLTAIVEKIMRGNRHEEG
jgi:hypothetical protein